MNTNSSKIITKPLILFFIFITTLNVSYAQGYISETIQHDGLIREYSIYVNGGPQDVILPLGGVWNIGEFELSMQMYVTNGDYLTSHLAIDHLYQITIEIEEPTRKG